MFVRVHFLAYSVATKLYPIVTIVATIFGSCRACALAYANITAGIISNISMNAKRDRISINSAIEIVISETDNEKWFSFSER